MEDNVNTLTIARDKAGKRVDELEKKRSDMAVKLAEDPHAFSNEEIKKMSDDYNAAVEAREFAEDALKTAQNNLKTPAKGPVPVPGNKSGKEATAEFVSNFKDMVTSGKLPDGTSITGDGSNAGLTIPDDVQTQIHTLSREFDALEPLVNVENVTTRDGSRVYEKLSDITPLQDLDDEKAQIGDIDDPVLTLIKYSIHRYAGIQTATNTLLADTAENILAWLERWAARKDVVTRNLKIIEALGKATKKPTIEKFDDIKDLQLATLDPAIIATSSFITNQSGFAVLAKVKDEKGDYLMQPSVTNPEIYQIGGKTVRMLSDKYLPDVSGSHPLYFGDLKQGITLYDRQQMSVTPTTIGGGAFETDTTKIRYIDRFDVQQIDDGAYAIGSFKDIADQKVTVAVNGGSGASSPSK